MNINPVDAFLWTFRRNERDVVRMYSALTPVMRLATGGSMLNFGYWKGGADDPISAQRRLCEAFADLAELGSAGTVADVGSGLGAPARLWKGMHGNVSIVCVNTNYGQMAGSCGAQQVCSSSTRIPLSDGAVDRVLALESAQHFRPLGRFVSESRRILAGSGLLALAVPVVVDPGADLGILKLTWSSEHYGIGHVRGAVTGGGFDIVREEMIGGSVYSPLADYYVRERGRLRARILEQYPPYVESVLFRSIKRMKKASEDGVIDYVLLKCRPA